MDRQSASRLDSVKPWIAWGICLVAALFYAYDFFLRITPSVMVHPLMRDLGIRATEVGFISAFYYYAYTPMQVPAGVLIDHYSTRVLLGVSIGFCVVGTFLFADVANLYVACFARALMGFGSAFAFIGALKLAASWLPAQRFALFTGMATALGTIGALLADIILSRMVHGIGWHRSVIFTGWVGIVLGVIMVLLLRDNPQAAKVRHKQFHHWSHAWQVFIVIIKNGRFWINGIVGSLMFLPISVLASLWGVDFIHQAYHLTTQAAATATSLIFLGTAIGGPLAGLFSDRIKSRLGPMFIGTGVTFICLIIIIYITSLSHVLLYCLLLIMGIAVGAQVLVFAVGKEISPQRSTGMATAGTNLLVTLGAAIFQPLIGYFLDLSWNGVRVDGAALYTTHDYQFALSVLPAVLIISFILTFFIPETKCTSVSGLVR